MLVCPCEDVTDDDIRSAMALGASQPDDVKRVTRCGMGFCQGLYCEGEVQRLLALATTTSGGASFRKRVPVRPVSLSLLAIATEPGAEQSSVLHT